MLVYGDRERVAQTSEVLAQLSKQLAAVRGDIGDVSARESGLAALAIACGILVQALIDGEQAAHEEDELSEVACAGASLCLAAGRACVHGELAPVAAALSTLAACASETTLRLREPEGYAFYALYPELYVTAARTLDLPAHAVQVIGIRSIGTSLAGFVAAACGATRLPFSLRPVGDPFAREVRVGPALEAALLEDAAHAHYVIVDEGPGLSGSSFVAVASWLLAHGVAQDRITLLPSHAGEPGGHGTDAARARYHALKRSVVAFEQVFTPASLAHWFGESEQAPEVLDLSAGRWRALQYPDPAAYPPSDLTGERRKYLVRAGADEWLMKYVGLGPMSEAIVARARVLSAQRLTPALLGARHGFARSTFHREATPLPRAQLDRAAFVDHLARYLGFLARHFGNSPLEAGAAPAQLLTLLKHNAALLLGAERTAALARFDAQLARLTARHHPIAIDGKLDACEWLVLPDGSFRKCDAEAHHAAHDCIGCQDPAWDVAGASIELGLTEPERELVLARLRDDADVRIDAAQLTFYEIAYAAFRAGRAHYAMQPLAGWADDDAARLSAEKARYSAEIARRI